MGIGLVDPILPAIADKLHATPTQTEMLFTSWISSRIGAKRTLMIGLALIVVFALAAALSGNVETIIGFRAGWGLGNALFISTALATIVGVASGGTSSAIILYEAALGLGIAIGPLLGACSAASAGADRSSVPRFSWQSASSPSSYCLAKTRPPTAHR